MTTTGTGPPYKMGCLKDRLDPRDLRYRERVGVPNFASLPARASIREKCSPVISQGQTNSCTGQAIAKGLYEYLERSRPGGKTDFTASALYTYWYGRVESNLQGADGGAYLRDVMKAASKYGFAPDAVWPFDTQMVQQSPGKGAMDAARDNKPGEYHRIDNHDLAAMLACLASGNGLVGGVNVYDSWWTPPGGVIIGKKGAAHGGHAIFFVGYDMGARLLCFKNSWGKDWGDGGYGYLPFEYVQNEGNDFWTMTKLDHEVPSSPPGDFLANLWRGFLTWL